MHGATIRIMLLTNTSISISISSIFKTNKKLW